MRSRTVVLGLAMLLGQAPSVLPGSADGRLDVYWVDVEGGAATLIVTPAGESVLVDTGFPGGRDAGRIHQLATKVAGLRSIDHVVLTHYHLDHFGGLAELAALMPVGTLYERGLGTAPDAERKEPRLAAFTAAKVGKRVLVKPGDELPLKPATGGPKLRFRFLAGSQEFVPGGRANAAVCAGLVEKAPDPTDNANSLVMVLDHGPFRFFDGGDLTWNLEGKLVCPADRVGPVDVFQIGHHGADSSNNPVVIKTLTPTVVVVNNGPRKGGEKESVAGALATPSVKAVYQLHRNVREGSVNTADELIANREESCTGEHVKLSVDGKGESYTLAVPATRHERAFKTRPVTP